MPCVPDNMHSTQGNCTNVALCKYNTDGDPPVYSDIGEQRNVMCETSDDYKFVLIYPIANPDIPTHQSKVIIVCNDSLPGPELNLISEKEMIFSLSTHCGCANQCSPPKPTTAPVPPKPTTAPVPASTHNVPTTPSTPGDSKSNWELTILLPSVLVIVIVFCPLCLWWKRAAIREALRLRCCLCCEGYNDLGVEEERNDLGVEEERQECVTETSALLKNQPNNQAVEHEDPGGKGKLKEPVQVEEGDVGGEYTSIRKDNKTAIV